MSYKTGYAIIILEIEKNRNYHFPQILCVLPFFTLFPLETEKEVTENSSGRKQTPKHTFPSKPSVWKAEPRLTMY